MRPGITNILGWKIDERNTGHEARSYKHLLPEIQERNIGHEARNQKTSHVGSII